MKASLLKAVATDRGLERLAYKMAFYIYFSEDLEADTRIT